MKKTILTKNAPPPIGAYSQGISAGNMIFTSGQLPVDNNTGEMITDDIESASRAALNNVIAVVEAAGGSRETVLKTTAFLKDLSDFPVVNKVYDEVFPQDPPARSAIQVSRLPKDAIIEIEAIAYKK